MSDFIEAELQEMLDYIKEDWKSRRENNDPRSTQIDVARDVAYVFDPKAGVSRWKLRLEWKPQDLWIGAFWKWEKQRLHVWICLLPMLPIHFTFDK
jgi:hypothetical protein